MTSRELIAAEANNTDRIALYREGLFWKAYERSAYALCTQVRRFKPTRKILKTLAGGDIVSVGFPAIAADRILAGLQRLDLPADASAGSAGSAADSSLSCISDASSAAGASDAAVAVSVGSDACAAGSVANASVGSCAAPKAASAACTTAASAGSAGSATRMLLVAPHPIVERDFLAWKSALPISLTIPRPSAAESSCEDPTSGEPSSHDLPLREGSSSRERSLHEAEPLRESPSRGASAGLATPVGAADSAGSATLAAPTAPASAATAAQPHWWTRLGGRLVRWAARSGFPRAVAANAAAGGFVEFGSPASVGFAAGSADDSSLSCISDVSSPAVSAGAAAPAPAAPVLEVAASTAANPAASTASSVSSVSAEQCLDALRKFEVADKTPMECMLFIAELKKRFLS